MTDERQAGLRECAEVCTSGCHSDDCEHHDHLPAQDELLRAALVREYALIVENDRLRAALALAQVPAQGHVVSSKRADPIVLTEAEFGPVHGALPAQEEPLDVEAIKREARREVAERIRQMFPDLIAAWERVEAEWAELPRYTGTEYRALGAASEGEPAP